MKFGLTRFIKRVLGHPDGGDSAVPAISEQSAPAAAAQSYAVAGDMPILHRREIVDDRKRLCGYQFSVSWLQPGRPLSESLYCEILHSAGIPSFATRRMAVIPVEPGKMTLDRYLVFNGQQGYLMVDVRSNPLDRGVLLKELEDIRAAGGKIALTGVSVSRDELPLLEVANLVFLVLDEYPLSQFQKLVRHLRALYPELALVVDGVESWPEYRMCVAWGVKYCLGHFLTTMDTEEAKGEIDHSHMVSIELLNLLRSEAELEELTEVAKKDPGITFKLLGWANSPAMGLATTITSLSQAIVILGREELYRWLTVSMFRMGAQKERNESLLEIALSRARFLECLPTEGLSKRQREELFLVGLFSLFDVLMEVPMAQILAKVQLGDEVADAIQHNRGPYARFLNLVLFLEHGRDSQAADLAEALELDFQAVQAEFMQAFAWAQTALGPAG